MNLRNVLRAYSLLRQLSDEESALLQTLRLTNETERALLVETLSDKPQKKSSKKGAGKSVRASGMAAQLNKQLSNRAQSLAQPPATAAIDEDGDSANTRCQFTQRYDGKLCLLLPDHNIHHLATHPEYHEFQPAEQAAATSGD